MLKYYDYFVTCLEVPDEISLAFSISGCQIRCKDCHSPHLWEDVGTDLTIENIIKVVDSTKYISCICLMGGEHDVPYMVNLFEELRQYYPEKKLALYSGAEPTIDNARPFIDLDYFKFGPYRKELGGLDSEKTNQVFQTSYHLGWESVWKDTTYKFRKK